jgi:hypothetical protein
MLQLMKVFTSTSQANAPVAWGLTTPLRGGNDMHNKLNKLIDSRVTNL